MAVADKMARTKCNAHLDWPVVSKGAMFGYVRWDNERTRRTLYRDVS